MLYQYAVSKFNRSEDINGVPKFETLSRGLSHTLLGVNSSSRQKGLHALYYHTKFEAHCFTRSKVMEELLILKLGHVTLNTPTLGVNLVVRCLVDVTVNVCTKYEVSIFGHSKDMKRVLKFRNWSRDLIHACLGVKFSYSEKGLHGLY